MTTGVDYENFGLYLHVPYCKAICHYCDFAKTANFGAEHGQMYIARLTEHLRAWCDLLDADGVRRPFTSVFFGGGTPSLYGREYAPLFELINTRLAPGGEVTLEANPDDVSPERLGVWRELGVNRLSLGVQTFDPRGLAYLKRAHDADAARQAVAEACSVFASVNLDLIYGWGGAGPDGQQVDGLGRDIDEAVRLGIKHLSLYTLTYESRTPIGRAVLRGLYEPASDERLAAMYEQACDQLGAASFVHDEVSNWSRPGHACRHNRGYWWDQPYLGIGAGAHGYLNFDDGIGERYAYPRSDRAFLRWQIPGRAGQSWPERFGVEYEIGRTPAMWLTEYVGSALRTSRGISLGRIERLTGRRLRPTPLIATALERGIIIINNDVSPKGEGGQLVLQPTEWFRETAWGVELLKALV